MEAVENAEMRQKMEELAKETETKSVAVLTPEQKTKWTEMQGARSKGNFARTESPSRK